MCRVAAHNMYMAHQKFLPSYVHGCDSCLLPPPPRLDDKHVVFGSVQDAASRAVVDSLEQYGSRSGKTSPDVVVTACSC